MNNLTNVVSQGHVGLRGCTEDATSAYNSFTRYYQAKNNYSDFNQVEYHYRGYDSAFWLLSGIYESSTSMIYKYPTMANITGFVDL